MCAAQAMDEPEGRAAARLKVGAAAFWPAAAEFADTDDDGALNNMTQPSVK